MEQREYIHRRGGGPVRRPSRRNGPPRIVWVILALVIIAGAAVLVWFLRRGSGEDNGESSSAPESSQVVSLPAAEDEPASAPEATSSPVPSAALPDQLSPDSEPTDMESFMIAGGRGYDYYHFNEDATNSFILAVDEAAKSISSANFYSMVVPTAMDVMLKESYLLDNSVDSSDQRKAIDDYIYSSISAMNSSVKTVPTFTPLREHCDEYIYFNSDRTWTQLGAYYAYRSYCSVKGIEPAALDSFTKQEYTGFSGGFYRETGSDALYDDTVAAYFPGGNTSMSFTDRDGLEYDGWAVITDGDGYDSSLLYLIFAAGDQPYKVLENSDITDNSACVVVQDSFGNYFIPFLTQHYHRVYVVDYNYYSSSVPELVSESGATDVILLTNVIATSSSSAVESLQSIF